MLKPHVEFKVFKMGSRYIGSKGYVLLTVNLFTEVKKPCEKTVDIYLPCLCLLFLPAVSFPLCF